MFAANLPGEKPFGVLLVLHRHRAILQPHDICVIDEAREVGRVGIPCPFEEPYALMLAVVAAMLGTRLEGLANVIRCEDGAPTRCAMNESCLDCLPKVGGGCHVRDGVVYEHSIELTAESDGSHVSWKCSQSGLSERLTASMSGAMSTSTVSSK